MLKVLFFAQLKETLDCGELELEIADMTTVNDVISHLSNKNETWAKALSAKRLMMAVNQDLVTSHSEIKDGDELAIFPPVTGG